MRRTVCRVILCVLISLSLIGTVHVAWCHAGALPPGFVEKDGAGKDQSSGLPTEIICVKDGSEMVFVKAGEFLLGTDEETIHELSEQFDKPEKFFAAEKPQRKVYLDGFYIDKYEVNNAQYTQFVLETGARPSGTFGRFAASDQPAVCVNWYDADAYCKWAGKQLPTEAEWEKAARGTDGRVYPWGDQFEWSRCNSPSFWAKKNLTPEEYSEWIALRFKDASSKKIGFFANGVSVYGCYEMAGNVMEWCRDWFDPGYYKTSGVRNPTGPDTGTLKVVRGGSFGNFRRNIRCAARYGINPRTRLTHIGFRCVLELR